MLKVFVALGKQLPKNKIVLEDTQEVARLLAKYNCTMMQGGAKVGLMGLVVSEFQKYSDEVIMVVPEAHKSDLEDAKNKEAHIVESESDRLKMTIKDCDLMVVLPGGSGTLAELAFYSETKKSGEHNARIVVVNSNGYYNGLFKFFKHQVKMGFLKQECLDKMFDVVKNARGLEVVLQELLAEKHECIYQCEVKEEAKKECKNKKVAEEKPVKKACKKDKVKEVKPELAEVKAEVVEPIKKENKKVASKDVKVKKAEAKKPEAKKVEAKKVAKTEVKKAETKKPVKKVEDKKVEEKKIEVKKSEIKKPATKKVAKKEVKNVKASAKKSTTKSTKPETVKAKKNTTAKKTVKK